MKLTWNEIPQKYEEIKKHLTEATKSAYEACTGFWNMYDDDDFRPSIDAVVELINDEIKDIDTEPKPKQPKEPKPIAKPKPQKQPKPKKAKFKVGDKVFTDHSTEIYSVVEIDNGKYKLDHTSGWWSESQLKKVTKRELDAINKKALYKRADKDNTLSPEIKIIKRYIGLHNKVFNVANKDKARQILSALQKYIIGKEIRKTSEYAKEINEIQDVLLKMMKARACTDVVEIDHYQHLKDIVEGSAVWNNVTLLKSFIGIVGTKADEKKASNLLSKMKNSEDTNYREQMNDAMYSLEKYINHETDVVEASQQVLEGLYGLCGIDAPKMERMHQASASQLANTYFDCLHLKGKWEKIIGKPDKPFKLMIYGKPGSGKSTLALQFAGALASKYGQKVLYVASEEGLSYTMKEKLERLNIKSPNLIIVDSMPKDVKQYDSIFIDSVNNAGYTPEELRKLPQGHNYIYVMQTTKQGVYRGSQEFLHDVDTCVKVEEMHAHTEKNRFGAVGDAMVMDGDDVSKNNWNTFVMWRDRHADCWKVIQKGKIIDKSWSYSDFMTYPLTMTAEDVKRNVNNYYAPNKFNYEVVKSIDDVK